MPSCGDKNDNKIYPTLQNLGPEYYMSFWFLVNLVMQLHKARKKNNTVLQVLF